MISNLKYVEPVNVDGDLFLVETNETAKPRSKLTQTQKEVKEWIAKNPLY